MILNETRITQDLNALPMAAVTPDEVFVDPATFQFRRSTSHPSGVIGNAQYQGEWDNAIHGKPLLVYEYNNGQKFVVDGHHRLEFAKRLNAHRAKSAPSVLTAQIIREKDGITPEHAKIIGAYRNMERYGIDEIPSGEKLLEAADILRSAMKEPEFAHTLPALPKTAALVDAAAAATLPDDAYQLVHTLPEPIAVNLGAYTATRDMPDIDKVQVLHIIANRLANFQTHTLA